MPDIITNKPPIKIMAREKGPGPIYGLHPLVGYDNHDVTKFRNPAYTIGERRRSITSKYASPGPVHYIEQGTTRYGAAHKSPGCTIGTRIPSLKRFGVPGPGTYSPENFKYVQANKPPAYTIGERTYFHPKSMIPGPNAYNLPTTIGARVPNKETAAAYTMIPRRAELRKFQTPGPNAYGAPDIYLTRNKPPAYTITNRTNPLRQRGPRPGPAEYYPMYRPGPKEPGFTFGIKHSEYTTELIADDKP